MDDAASRRLGRRVIHGPHELVEVIQKLHVVRFGDGEMPVVEEHGVVIEERPGERHGRRRGAVLGDHELRRFESVAIMASSTFGSLRMNSPENPPMVDWRMIDTIGCPCLALRRPVQADFVVPPRPDAARGSTQSWRTVRGDISRRNRQGSGKGVCNVSIDHLAGRSRPSATISAPWHRGLAPVSGRRAVALRLGSGRRGAAEQAVPGKEQFLSVVCRFS